MLLIGSRAAKYHFPFFRKPNDYDFIATKSEVKDFLSNFKYTDISTHEKKVRARIDLGRPTTFEFELSEHYESSNLLRLTDRSTVYQDDVLKSLYHIASPETLLLLKRTHLPFNIHWKKNMADYLFLKQNVDMNKLNDYWHRIHDLRFEEIKERVKYKERSFDVSNSDFFKVSEKMVNRLIPHDNIHWATCFFGKPMFMTVKDDLSRAEMNPDKVNALSFDHKIKLIQEETMALAIERYILPSAKAGKIYDSHEAYATTAGKMVYNYLPMFLRFFAIDNFLEVLNLPIDYVSKFFKNVKGLPADVSIPQNH